MLRLAGAMCCFCALSWAGIRKARWFRRRTACLECWIGATLEIERLICDLGMDTSACLAGLRERSELTEMMKRCLNGLRDGEPLMTVWQSELAGSDFPLKEDELRQIGRIGAVLGRYDAEQQRREYIQIRHRLEQSWQSARNDDSRMSRMYAALGVSAGALAAVLLY